MSKQLLTFFLFIFSTSSFAFFEVGGNYGYKRLIYGANRENKNYDRSYSGFIAKYLFNLTAIEVNVSHSQNVTEEKWDAKVEGTTYSATKMRSDVMTNVWGIGLRQAFAHKKAFLVPMLSLGYARQIAESTGYVEYTNSVDGSKLNASTGKIKQSSNSLFGTFSLKLRLTKFFSLTGSASTVFPAFAFERLQDNVKYSAGFSWMF
ncbi:MAG: hypothetical protein KAG61_09585 [Bacteriovoracaceae bacterium]|nr:hypothetical protein [Bacteriovoracaceae bacterium]